MRSAEEAEAARWRDALRAAPADADTVVKCRNAMIRWALALEAVGDDAPAVGAWIEAEDRQWQIGTWSTGSGEGLASMGCVYELMLRRAAAEERLAARSTGEDAAAHLRAALALLEKIAADPNDMGERVLTDRHLGTEWDLPLPPAPRPKWPR